MKYGRFSNDGREYVINRMDIPRPWINYLSNDHYCALVSHTGGGYSFYESSGYDRVLREYPGETLFGGRPGRYLYIQDLETGEHWSPNGNNISKFKAWECRHGLGYTKISTLRSEIECKITYFVPLHDNCEVWMVRLKNKSGQKRRLSAIPYVEWCLGNFSFDLIERSFANLFNEVTFEDGIIFTTKRYWDTPVARRRTSDRLYSLNPNLAWDKYAFMTANFPVDSFDCLKEKFIGLNHSWLEPIALKQSKLSNSLANGEELIGALKHNFELQPEEEKNFVVLVGIAFRKEEAKALASKYNSWEKTFAELERLKKHWETYLELVKVETPDKDFDLSVNIWNKYQALIIARWSRMDSAYIGGGSIFGFRDTCQDILSVLPVDLRWAKERTILVLKHQFQDGRCLHNWDPRTNLGTDSGHSDDHLWLVLAIINYLKESGDFSFLNELVKFYDGGPGTVYQHMIRAIEYALSMRSLEVGGFGISLMGAADWNDGLDQVGKEGIGESVMTTEFLCWMLQEVAEVAKFQGDEKLSKRYLAEYQDLKKKLNLLCWDGEWYIRAINDRREILGSSRCDEGKIYLNAQSWAVMSGVATGERAITCMDAVKEHLDTKYGPVLLAPAYSKPDANIGIITRFAPGTKENAAIFNHSVSWAIIAECILGRGERAYEYFKKTSFIERGKEPDIYKVEPYVYAEFVYGPDSVSFGQGSFTWTTGTAAWMWRVCLDWILGIRPGLTGLRIDPCIPPHWKGYKVRRCFRNSVYEITVKNPHQVSKGVKEVKIDGKRARSNLLPVFGDSRTHKVEVVMG